MICTALRAAMICQAYGLDKKILVPKNEDFLAAEPGFEPRMTESEAGVLPLHYSAELQLQPFTLVYSITIESVCQYLFSNLYKKLFF